VTAVRFNWSVARIFNTGAFGGSVQIFRDMGSKLGIAGELLSYLWQAKMWWMIPLVFVLLSMGLLNAFGTASGLGPFFYTLF
jgi:hypothetical protein